MGPSYKAMLGTHVHNENEISHKVEKEGKPHGENPPPKREIKKQDAWMDGVVKTPSTHRESISPIPLPCFFQRGGTLFSAHGSFSTLE